LLRAVLIAGVLTPPAAAKVGTPGLAWFAGHYDRIGHDGGAPQRPYRDGVTLAFRGDRLEMTACDGRVMVLIHDPSFDYSDRLVGRFGDVPVECQYRGDGAHRPVMVCDAADGASFTLWPVASTVGPSRGTCVP
jgi:hypothetical protein